MWLKLEQRNIEKKVWDACPLSPPEASGPLASLGRPA